jgi:D-alanyl-D-alanine carboxypeptidase
MDLKFFYIALLLSLPFWWGINFLEKDLSEIFYWQEIEKNHQILTAQINQQINITKIENLEISAESAISVCSDGGKKKILFEKNSDKKLPIASLSKLMTASVVLEHYDMEQLLKISKRAAEQPGIEAGKLKAGEKFFVKDALCAMLIGSNNTVAYALAEMVGEQGFVDLMNLEAKKIKLENTVFKNPTGLDYFQQYSTTKDLVKLTDYLLNKHPVIWEILVKPEF